MESLLMEQTLSPRKQIKTPKRKTYNHHNNYPQNHHMQQTARNLSNNISRQSSLNYNYGPPSSFVHEFDNMMMMHGGFFLNNNHPSNNNNNATPLFHQSLMTNNSLPPMFPAKPNLHHHQQQPPLLPLPAVTRPSFRSLPPLSRRKSLSCQVFRKSPTKNKSPQKSKDGDKNVVDQVGKAKGGKLDGPIEESGPTGPTKVQEEIAKELLEDLDALINAMEMEKFSGSVFSLAPPPSSLPLPKFCLRQQRKLSCNAKAAAVAAAHVSDDHGATDNLCKLLRLQ